MEIVGADNPLELKLSSTSGFGASRLSFISDKDTNNEWRPAYIESGDNATGAFWGRLDFYTNCNGAGNKFGATRAMSVANGNLGIGYTNPSDKLEVNGKTKTTNLQITNGATANYVLQSDAAGNGSWVNNNGGFTHYLGELYLGGVIFELHKEADGLEHGLVVSTTQGSGSWQTTNSLVGANRSEDGSFNTNLMTNSPAKDYVATLGVGWYIPSVDEMYKLYSNAYIVQKTLRAGGYTLLNHENYIWTSTENAIGHATQMYGYSLSFGVNTKEVSMFVRGIKSF